MELIKDKFVHGLVALFFALVLPIALGYSSSQFIFDMLVLFALILVVFALFTGIQLNKEKQSSKSLVLIAGGLIIGAIILGLRFGYLN